MANMEREWKLRPSPFARDTLEGCIRDFLWRREPGHGLDVKADDIPALCAMRSTFEDAVWTACASKRANGKMHPHQTKVSIDARRKFGANIIRHYINIEGHLRHPPVDFDDLHDNLWNIRPEGIGPLTTYDVATRVGAYLSLYPTQIYLHTGAMAGWRALMGSHARPALRVPPEEWPHPLPDLLTADQAEDFLCAYRAALARVQRDAQGRPV